MRHGVHIVADWTEYIVPSTEIVQQSDVSEFGMTYSTLMMQYLQ